MSKKSWEWLPLAVTGKPGNTDTTGSVWTLSRFACGFPCQKTHGRNTDILPALPRPAPYPSLPRPAPPYTLSLKATLMSAFFRTSCPDGSSAGLHQSIFSRVLIWDADTFGC